MVSPSGGDQAKPTFKKKKAGEEALVGGLHGVQILQRFAMVKFSLSNQRFYLLSPLLLRDGEGSLWINVFCAVSHRLSFNKFLLMSLFFFSGHYPCCSMD